MLCPFIRTSFVLLVIYLLLSPSSALRSFGGRGYNSGKYSGYNGYKEPSKSKTYAGTSSGIPSQNATRRGLGISAWGIVSVIVFLFLAGMGFYYFAMCYPFLCQKDRKYDIMKLDNTCV